MKEFWICIVGAIDRDKLYNGFEKRNIYGVDAPMRNGVENAYKNEFNKHPDNLWTGWGYAKEMVNILLRITSLDINSEKMKKIVKILNNKL